MKHLKHPHKEVLAFSMLLFTWVLLFFFLRHYDAYERVIHRMSFVEGQSGTEVLLIKLKNKPEPRCGEYQCFTGQEFVDFYNNFEEERSVFLTEDKEILGLGEIDDYIKDFAESLGYQERSFSETEDLIEFNALNIFPEVKDAYISLRNDMSRVGIDLHLVSAHRSFEDQRNLFIKMLGLSDFEGIPEGLYDRELAVVLERSALPGYSKHHSGRAIDFGCGDKYLVFEFAETECYEWMSHNNFERTKKHGLIPSYPEGVDYQGPNPEPWEYVYVGEEVLK